MNKTRGVFTETKRILKIRTSGEREEHDGGQKLSAYNPADGSSVPMFSDGATAWWRSKKKLWI